jgi:hypothetical protein
MRWKTARLSAAVLVVVLFAFSTSDSAAQVVNPNPNRGKIMFIGGFDFATAYMFRGMLRDDTRVVLWPYTEATVDLFSGREGLKNVTLHLGTWNSLHTGATGYNSGFGKLWYESDIYGTLGVRFGPDVTVAATYTAYMSPNDSFTTIKELSFKAAVDDAGSLGIALRPYGLVAFELDTIPGFRQADQGLEAGTYFEAGVAPGWVDPDFRVEFPIKVGISLDDYYELNGVDQKFGFLSLAAVATVPLSRTSSYGSWNVHGGVEFLSLGNTPEALNGGDQMKLIGSIGIGFSY